MITVYISGGWDPFHIGHLNVIQIAAGLGDRLVVGVATDDRIREYKQREPCCSFNDRIRIMSELRSVDVVIPYSGPEDMTPIDLFNVNIVIADQLRGRGKSVLARSQRRALVQLRKRGVTVVRVPRTPGISSTLIRSFTHD